MAIELRAAAIGSMVAIGITPARTCPDAVHEKRPRRRHRERRNDGFNFSYKGATAVENHPYRTNMAFVPDARNRRTSRASSTRVPFPRAISRCTTWS